MATVLFDSDLAEERRGADFEGGGILFSEENEGGIRFTRLCVMSKEGEDAIGRPMGRYLTVGFGAPYLLPEQAAREAAEKIADALRELLPQKARRILVLGLGNRRLTADCIGVRCAELLSERLLPSDTLAVLTPGTYGETSIESACLARAAVREWGADALILIDALASRDKERLVRAVELCDTGLSPGTGVGNRREAIDPDNVGVPTVAIGIPTVMRASAFLSNAMILHGFARERAAEAAKDGRGLFTVPAQLDDGIESVARIVVEALFSAFTHS